MQSIPVTPSFPRALLPATWICVALAGCATQQDLRVESLSNSDLRLAASPMRGSSANSFGPNAEFVEPVAALSPSIPAPSARPQAESIPMWYLMAGVGDACIDGTTGNDMAVSYSVSAGYQFMPWLSVEGGYTDFGKADVDPVAPSTDHTIASEGFDVSAVGHYHIFSVFDAIARAGAIRWNETQKDNLLSDSKDDGVALIWGFGVQAAIAGHLGARLEWDRVEKSDAIDNFLLSLIWTL